MIHAVADELLRGAGETWRKARIRLEQAKVAMYPRCGVEVHQTTVAYDVQTFWRVLKGSPPLLRDFPWKTGVA